MRQFRLVAFLRRVCAVRPLSAIALMGLSLVALDMPPMISRAGGYLLLSAGSAAAATALKKEEETASNDDFRQVQINELIDELTGNLYASVLAEQALYLQLSQVSAGCYAELVDAQTRIEELEGDLADKTELATQMLSELESEATRTFDQFTHKINAQNQLIEELSQQNEDLQKKNLELLNQQFAAQRPSESRPSVVSSLLG